MTTKFGAAILLLAAGPAIAADAETWRALKAKERNYQLMSGNNPMLGASYTEKSSGAVVCIRVQPAVLNPTPVIKCYRRVKSANARGDYDKMSDNELRVVYAGAKDGKVLYQKGFEDVLCRRWAASETATFTYACYNR